MFLSLSCLSSTADVNVHHLKSFAMLLDVYREAGLALNELVQHDKHHKFLQKNLLLCLVLMARCQLDDMHQAAPGAKAACGGLEAWRSAHPDAATVLLSSLHNTYDYIPACTVTPMNLPSSAAASTTATATTIQPTVVLSIPCGEEPRE